MSGPQKLLSQNSPDPVIRNLLGNPVGSGEIKTTMLNGSQVVGPPFGVKSNKWLVAAGQSPQNIAGALDETAKEDIEEGIYHDFIARPWPDERHMFIVTCDLLFALRSKTQATGTATMLNLGSMNVTLREGFELNEQRYKEYIEDSEWSGVEPLSERDLFGERMYAHWKNTNNFQSLDKKSKKPKEGVVDESHKTNTKLNVVAGRSNEIQDDLNALADHLNGRRTTQETNEAKYLEAAIKASIKSEWTDVKEESSTYALSRKFWEEKKDLSRDGLRYLYMGSILDHWSLIGVVRSSTNDTGYENRYVNNARGKGVDLSVIIAKKTHTLFNFWSNDLSIGDKLFLILKRVKTPSGLWGPFQFIPFSNGRHYPTREDLVYEDISGAEELGYVIYVGSLSEKVSFQRPQETRALACGLVYGRNSKDAFDAAVVLDKLTVHFRF